MVCPFAALSSHPAGTGSTKQCQFSSPTDFTVQQLQQCPVSGASRSRPLTDDSSAAMAWQSNGTLTPSSSSESLTEHVTLGMMDHTDTVQSGAVSSLTGTTCLDQPPSISGSTFTTTSTSGTHQSWQIKRPVLAYDPKLTRRQLRRLGCSWKLADVAKHRYCNDGWIAVDGKVYDITEHLVNHPGWDSGCQVTTVLSIIAHLGSDCSEEFREIHRPYPVAWKQLQAYYIGDLQQN